MCSWASNEQFEWSSSSQMFSNSDISLTKVSSDNFLFGVFFFFIKKLTFSPPLGWKLSAVKLFRKHQSCFHFPDLPPPLPGTQTPASGQIFFCGLYLGCSYAAIILNIWICVSSGVGEESEADIVACHRFSSRTGLIHAYCDTVVIYLCV